MNTKLLTTSKQDIEEAGRILKSGGLVAFPTETVYGLGANALDEAAVKSIYAAKGRPSDNPLIVHIARKEDFAPLVKEITPKAQALIDAFFPAPLTVILPKSDLIGSTVSGGLGTVAVRMPQNETARAVIAAAGCPIAAPSANTSGKPSPTNAQYVFEDMNGRIDAIVDGGECEFGVESTVITLAGEEPVILRPGAVTQEMIEAVIGRVRLSYAVLNEIGENETAASPGMKYKHYAPQTRVILVEGSREAYERFVNLQSDAAALCFEGDNITVPKVTFGVEGDDLSQSHSIFAALRRLDEIGAKKAYARAPEKSGVGMAVYNRLIRAAAFCVLDLRKPFTIGLTGLTGAGKGYVCNCLSKKGFQILDTDAYARRAVEKNSSLLPVLAREFGQDIIEDGVLNRALLAKRAFSSKEKTALLNEIMHPAIIEMCLADAKCPCVLDAPQLFESGADKLCSRILCVSAPEDIRLERIMKRDGISQQQALERMNAQLDNKVLQSKADFVIINDGRDVSCQLDEFINNYL